MQIVPSIYTAVPRRKKIGIFRRKGKYCKTVPLAIWHADLVLMWEYHATPLVQCQIIMNTSLRYILGTVKTSMMISGLLLKLHWLQNQEIYFPERLVLGYHTFFLAKRSCWFKDVEKDIKSLPPYSSLQASLSWQDDHPGWKLRLLRACLHTSGGS